MSAKYACLFLVLLTAATGTRASRRSCNILLTNDDGAEAPALLALERALGNAGHKVLSVAPAKDRSASSSSRNPVVIGVTPPRTFRLERLGRNKYAFDGTPVDSVQVALKTIIPAFRLSKPDLIISGPNVGPNLGIQGALQSGTVGAALNGASNGIPSIAISIGLNIDEFPTFNSTFEAIPGIVKATTTWVNLAARRRGCRRILRNKVVFNVNVPVPLQNVTGVKFAKLGKGSFGGLVYDDPEDNIGKEKSVDLIQKLLLPDPSSFDGDLLAFAKKKITVTPLSPDLGVMNLRKLGRLTLVRKALKSIRPGA